jgi:hypothetical protein
LFAYFLLPTPLQGGGRKVSSYFNQKGFPFLFHFQEMEILGETSYDETVEARKWKESKGKNKVTFTQEKKEKQGGTGQRGADPAPTPKRWVE